MKTLEPSHLVEDLRSSKGTVTVLGAKVVSVAVTVDGGRLRTENRRERSGPFTDGDRSKTSE